MYIHIEKKKAFLLFIAGFLLLPASVLLAQEESEKGLPFITNYLPKEYKSATQNWSVVEADNGMMYFGNGAGVLEYDGVKWRLINLGGTNVSRALDKDKKGRIYYGTSTDFGYLAPDSLGLNQATSLLKYIPVSERNFNDIWTIHATNEGVYFQAREKIFRLKQIREGKNETWQLKHWKPDTKFMYAFSVFCFVKTWFRQFRSKIVKLESSLGHIRVVKLPKTRSPFIISSGFV